MARRSVLKKLQKLRVVSWEWGQRAREVGMVPGERAIGVIAQELEELFPPLVRRGEDGYRRVDYAGLAALAVAGLKELSAEVDRLKASSSRRRAPSSRASVRR